jgi:hypothetical protein
MCDILKLANEYKFPVTARGGGVGYTGGAVPVDGGIVVGTDRMNRIIEISPDDLYVVCQPGLTTFELQQAVEKYGCFSRPTRRVIKTRLSAATSRKRGRNANAEIRRNETFGFRLGSRNGDGRSYPNRRQNRQKRRRFRFSRLDVRLECECSGIISPKRL